MELLDDLLKILREEYGIKSPAELDAALAKQQRIDISMFCTLPKKAQKAG